MQRGAERAGRVGLAHRLLHLAEDLRLAQHHRIEPGGDAEGMARRGAVFQHVGVGLELGRRDAAVLGQPVDGRPDQGRPVRRMRRPRTARCGCRWTGAPPPGAARWQALAQAPAAPPCSWSGANANRPRRSSGAVVWFRPRAKTLMAAIIKFGAFSSTCVLRAALRACDASSLSATWVRSTRSGTCSISSAPRVGVGAAGGRAGQAAVAPRTGRRALAPAGGMERGCGRPWCLLAGLRRSSGATAGWRPTPRWSLACALALWWAGFGPAPLRPSSQAASRSRDFAAQRMRQRLRDRHVDHLTDQARRALEVDDAVALGAAHQLVRDPCATGLRPGCAARVPTRARADARAPALRCAPAGAAGAAA